MQAEYTAEDDKYVRERDKRQSYASMSIEQLTANLQQLAKMKRR
jgi:hypothetical protein